MLRYPLVAALIIGNLFLAMMMLSVVGKSTYVSNARTTTDTAAAATNDDPNIIAGGATVFIDSAAAAVQRVGVASGKLTQIIAIATANLLSTAAATTYLALKFTAYATFRSIVFVAKLPFATLGFMADKTSLTGVMHPASASAVPTIQQNVPIAYVATKDMSATQAAIAPAAAPTPASAESIWPIRGQVTTQFGASDWPYQLVHSGIDISDGRASGVTPIRPFRAGRVIAVQHSYISLGNHVTVDHGNGLTSVYAHMSSTAVLVGQIVNTTTTLGFEGSTGASTGTHLHFETWLNGTAVNPHNYIAGQP